jgi:hypothetical protein
MVTREQLNKLSTGDWIVVIDEKKGRKRASFVRVTRAGKGNDVMIDVPKFDNGSIKPSDYVRQVIPIDHVISIVKDGAKKAAKNARGRKVEVAEVEAWRQLAEDAIKAMRRLVEDSDDELRAAGFRALIPLERRQATLAGQLEMFQS